MDGPAPGPPLEFYDDAEPPPKANGKDHAPPESYTQEPGVKIGKLVVLSDHDAKASAPREYYLKGLISPAEMSVAYGEPGSGKTFWVLYMARAIAQGREILGKKVHSTNVLYMALEGQSGFEKRLKAFMNESGQTENFYYIAQPVNLFSDTTAPADVISALKHCDAGVLIVDTLNRAMGEGSENDPSDMGQFIQAIDQIRTLTGAHVMIIHHSGKDSSRGPRGHSALMGAADLVMEISRKPDATDRAVKITKAKDDPDGGGYLFKLKPVELGVDDDGDEITSCVVEEITDREPSTKKSTLTAREKQWLEQIHECFARSGKVEIVQPEIGMNVTFPCVSRQVLRDWIRARGLVGVTDNVTAETPMTEKERQEYSRMFRALQQKKKIAVHNNLIWLVKD